MLQEEFKRIVEIFDMPRFTYLDEKKEEVEIYFKDGVSLKYGDGKIYVTLLNRAIDYKMNPIGNLRQIHLKNDTKEYEFYKNHMLNFTLIPYSFYVDCNSKNLSDDLNNLIKLVMNGFLNLSKYYDMKDGILLINQRIIDSYKDTYSDVFGYKKQYKLACEKDKTDRVRSNLRISINNFTSIANDDINKDKEKVIQGNSTRTRFTKDTRFIHVIEDSKAKWLYENRMNNYLLIERLRNGFGTQLELKNIVINHSFINDEEVIYIYMKNNKKEVIINLTNNTITFDGRTEELEIDDLRSLTNSLDSATLKAQEVFEKTRIKGM